MAGLAIKFISADSSVYEIMLDAVKRREKNQFIKKVLTILVDPARLLLETPIDLVSQVFWKVAVFGYHSIGKGAALGCRLYSKELSKKVGNFFDDPLQGMTIIKIFKFIQNRVTWFALRKQPIAIPILKTVDKVTITFCRFLWALSRDLQTVLYSSETTLFGLSSFHRALKGIKNAIFIPMLRAGQSCLKSAIFYEKEYKKYNSTIEKIVAIIAIHLLRFIGFLLITCGSTSAVAMRVYSLIKLPYGLLHSLEKQVRQDTVSKICKALFVLSMNFALIYAIRKKYDLYNGPLLEKGLKLLAEHWQPQWVDRGFHPPSQQNIELIANAVDKASLGLIFSIMLGADVIPVTKTLAAGFSA